MIYHFTVDSLLKESVLTVGVSFRLCSSFSVLIPWFHKMNWKQYQSWNSRWVPFITKNKAWLRYVLDIGFDTASDSKLWSSKAMLYAPITSLESLVVGNLLNRKVRLHVQHLQVTWRIYKLPSLINRYDWHPFFCIPILFSCLNWCRWKEPQHRLQAEIYVEASQTRQQQGCRQFLLLWKKVLWKKSLFGELVFTDGLLFNACFCGQRRYEPFIHSCKQKGRKYCFLLLLLQVGLSSGLSSQSPRFHNRNR